jgi:hypothetical protein
MTALLLPIALSAIVAIEPRLVARSAGGAPLFGQDDDRSILRMVRAAAVLACLTFLALLTYTSVSE